MGTTLSGRPHLTNLILQHLAENPILQHLGENPTLHLDILYSNPTNIVSPHQGNTLHLDILHSNPTNIVNPHQEISYNLHNRKLTDNKMDSTELPLSHLTLRTIS